MTVQRHWTKAYPHTPLRAPSATSSWSGAPPAVRGAAEIRRAARAGPRQLGDDLPPAPRAMFRFSGPSAARRLREALTYAEARAKADAVSAMAARQRPRPGNPVAALSDNSIAMGLLMLGAMQAGIPFMPVSPALFADVERLRESGSTANASRPR
ncbi:MAG: hypothetical protein U1F37_08830 [Alphaproteobacteria bacterium]